MSCPSYSMSFRALCRLLVRARMHWRMTMSSKNCWTTMPTDIMSNPGLTGWAQVNGYRGEMRTIADIEERIKYDLWYIDNGTLATDIRIIFMTVTELINGKNAY